MSKQEIMFQHVENWKLSGLTQATYCEGQNLKTPTFSYWVIKYQKQNTHLDSESAFITIEKQASLSCGNYEIVEMLCIHEYKKNKYKRVSKRRSTRKSTKSAIVEHFTPSIG